MIVVTEFPQCDAVPCNRIGQRFATDQRDFDRPFRGETLARAKKNGAAVISEPVDAEGVGRFGILRDPLGGMIGVIKPASA